jgi:hypothetical protein
MLVTKNQLRKVIREEIQKISESGWQRAKEEEFASGADLSFQHPKHGIVSKFKSSNKWHHIPYYGGDAKKSTHADMRSAMRHAESGGSKLAPRKPR